MKIIFFGTGSIGTRYVNILLTKYHHDLYAFRSGKKTQEVPGDVREIFSWKDFDKIAPAAVFITNPTALHIKTAVIAAKRNCALYLEKPIGSNLTGLDELRKIVKEKQIATYVAYNLRFHPVIQKLKEYCEKYPPQHMRILCTSYLPNWRPTQDFKKNYSASSAMGGGVILDLSHDIDYANYLFGDVKTMKGSFCRRSDLTADAEDYADIILSAEKGPVNIHINFMSHHKQRIIQIDFAKMTVVGDLISSNICIYEREKLVTQLKYQTGIPETYEKELKYFFENVKNPKMMNNLADAAKLFRQIIAFKNYE